METAKFTKGKWSILNSYHEENKKWICIFLEENTDISIDISCDLDDDKNNELEANSLLISKAPEMLEKLSEIVNILDIKCTDGCVNKTWRDFQNGNGEDVGLEIDKFIKDTKQLIKEATEL